MNNILMFGSFLSGAFDSFFSFLTLHQLHRQKGNTHCIRVINHGKEEFNYREIKGDNISQKLIDLYHFPVDLDNSYVLTMQNYYYFVGNYEDIIRNLQVSELNKNENLKNVLIFLTEPFDSSNKSHQAMMEVIKNLVPKKFHQNIVGLNDLTMEELSELCQNILDSTEDIKALVSVTSPTNEFSFSFVDAITSELADYIETTEKNHLYIKSSPPRTPVIVEFIQSRTDNIKYQKDFSIQDDLMNMFEICSLVASPSCSEVIVSTKQGLMKVQ